MRWAISVRLRLVTASTSSRPLLCQGEPNQASIAPVMATHDQALLDQAIAHARGGRRCDVHCFGKFGEALWTTGCKDNQSAVLGECHLFGYVPEGASCHGNQHPTGAQYGVDDCLTVDFGGEFLSDHILMIIVANDLLDQSRGILAACHREEPVGPFIQAVP